MEKERSKGVVFFAWLTIIINLVTLFSIGKIKESFSFLPNYGLIMMVVYSAVFGSISILASFKVLQLKAWARKAMIILAVVGILDMIVFVPLTHISVSKIPQYADSQFIEKEFNSLSAEARISLGITNQEEYALWLHKIGLIFGHIFAGILEYLVIIYGVSLLIFFTRPKVREQFK